jgi:hypothetical protein
VVYVPEYDPWLAYGGRWPSFPVGIRTRGSTWMMWAMTGAHLGLA